MQEFPKFIQNKPTGIDSLEGKSAERVAIAIESHIEKINDLNILDPKLKLPQIIGLEGEWGSGKSNVVQILKKNTEKNYYVFEYDAWGNQEDLQRRSFLEQLTKKLIDIEILNGYTKICKRNGLTETVKWEERLKFLLARKTEVVTERFPRISNSMAISGIVAILTPVFVFIAYATKPQNNTWWSILISILVSMLPILASLFVWLVACRKNGSYKNLGYLLSVHTDKIVNDVNYQTISEDEPSVSEFKAWMMDISDFIESKNNRKLIVVYDNMDRLPSDKVKELWSSIHTFFSEDGYKNIWVIIPFDQVHLANAFGDGFGRKEQKNQSKDLASKFITKTFPIIYRVAPPVLTDKKGMFNKFFKDAFGNTEDDSVDNIQRIFSVIKAEYTPRDIIAFINELVSLKQTWLKTIPLLSIAIFVLRREDIFEEIVDEYILSKRYLSSIEKIVDNTEELQNEIAALTYGIDINLAAQIPLKQYLRNTLKGEGNFDINKYSENRHFVPILDEEIKDLDSAFLDKAIISLSKLNPKNNREVKAQWDFLVKVQLQQRIDKLKFEDTHKALLKNVNDKNRSLLAEYLCRNFREFDEFKGDLFYFAMSSLEKFVFENDLNIHIFEYVYPKEVEPEIFIEYVNLAEKDFQKYKIACNNILLDNHLAAFVPSKLPNMDFVGRLVNDDTYYTFNKLSSVIEKSIVGNEINAENFPEIIKTYKLISEEKPLNQQFSTVQINNLISSTTDKESEAYYDIVAMALSNQLVDIAYTEGLDDKVAERIEYYKDYGSLLILSINWASVLLQKTMKVITEKEFDESKLEIKQILPFFEQIKDAIGVSGPDFLNRLNYWHVSAEEEINIGNVGTIIPDVKFYSNFSVTRNELTIHISNIVIEKIKTLPLEELYAQRNTPAYYWLNCISALIQCEFLNSLPDNLIDFCKKLLKDIASGSQAIPSVDSVLDIIVKKANKAKLLATIKSLGDDFCNRALIINPKLFMYFAMNFDFINKIDKREGAVARNILNVIINDETCLKHILENSIAYIKIITKADGDAEDLKGSIMQILKNKQDEKLIDFAAAIGLDVEKKKNIEA